MSTASLRPGVAPSAGGDQDATRYGLIGLGRVGTVVAARLLDHERALTAVSARSEESARRARAFAPGVPAVEPDGVVATADVVFLCVPDDALAEVAAELAPSVRPGQVLVHTSGRHGIDVLAPAVRAGARAVALHPAMTFTGADAHADDRRFAVGVTAAPEDLALADELARLLGGVPVPIAEADRVRYHAALSHGANHLVTLVAQARQILHTAGAGDEAELVLRPLLQASLDNALTDGDRALTGPVARGDAGTVAAHLAGLREDPELAGDVRSAYVALAHATAVRAEADTRLAPAAAQRVLSIVEGER